jgi:hypothetical protein
MYIACIVYFNVLTSLIREHFTATHYNIGEGIVIFQRSLYHCQRPSATREQEHVFFPVKARATLETGCPQTVLSQEHGQSETPQSKTVLS